MSIQMQRGTLFIFAMIIVFASGLILIGGGLLSTFVGAKENPPLLYAKASSGSCACCGSGSIAGSQDRVKQAEKLAIAYYSEKYGDSDVVARAIDYGCHVEVTIYKNEKAVKKLAVYGNTITEV